MSQKTENKQVLWLLIKSSNVIICSVINLKKIADYLIIIFGLAMIGFAVSVIIAPNHIIQGGVSGFSIIVNYLAPIPISVINLVTNLVLIIIGIKILGKGFIIKTLGCIFLLSFFIEIFSYIPPITNDKLLATIFGGVIYGAGIGITLLKGASSGGTDIVGRIFHHFFPHMSIGRLLLIIDGVVITIGYIAFRDVTLVLYGIIALCVSTFSIDYLIKKLNISKIAFVITDKGSEISEKLISTSGRGVTMLKVTGAYTKAKKTMLMCAVKEKEIPVFQKKIEAIDSEAFTIFCESQKIVGNGFHVYK